MKTLIIIFMFLLSVIPANAQSTAKATNPVNARLISRLTSKPEFSGGNSVLLLFIRKNLQYPQMESDNDITGTVKIGFVVDTSGEVTNAQIVQNVSRGLDREALRIVKMLPNWKPAMYYKKPMPVYYTHSVSFVLKPEK